MTFDGSPTTIDAVAVAAIGDSVIPVGTKGMPFNDTSMTLAELGASGLNLLDGSFSTPVMVLKRSAIEQNIRAMASYCAEHGVWLSPHGKTTMVPQLFRQQVEAGAWAMTAATPAHLRVYRRFGVQRIFYANELVEPGAIAWLAAELRRDPDFDFHCLVDSLASVGILNAELTRHGAPRPVNVYVELGFEGGRCGVRDSTAALEVASAADQASALQLQGLECFEGLFGGDDVHEEVDRLLAKMKAVAISCLEHTSLGDREEIVLTAGGSAYFDQVIRAFVDEWDHTLPARVVLRSGCYITQDGGFYAEASPLQGRCAEGELLRDGIEIWSVIVSRPEPGMVVSSMGRRDAPEDHGLPMPQSFCTPGQSPRPLTGAELFSLSDQHARIRIDAASELKLGDLICCSISHPCTTFDRWRVIPVVDDGYNVCDAVATFF